MSKSRWITVDAATQVLGVSAERVRRLCRDGRLSSRKWGATWQVSEASVTEYERTRRVGRPRKEEPER